MTFVRNLLRHYRNTGGMNPKQHGGGPKTKIQKNFDFLIKQKIQQKPDILFCELCQYLKSKTGVKVSISTIQHLLTQITF